MAIRPVLLPLGAAVLALLAGASRSGLLVSNAEASAMRRRDEDGHADPPLLLMPSDDGLGFGLIGHSSHSSHSSHASHSSHYSSSSGHASHYSGSSGYTPDYTPPQPAPTPPPPPRPALVSIVAFPGGRIYVDDKLRGVDATAPISLSAGVHKVRVENQFLGSGTASVTLDEGQTGTVNVEW
jgi:hypothetical protein